MRLRTLCLNLLVPLCFASGGRTQSWYAPQGQAQPYGFTGYPCINGQCPVVQGAAPTVQRVFPGDPYATYPPYYSGVPEVYQGGGQLFLNCRCELVPWYGSESVNASRYGDPSPVEPWIYNSWGRSLPQVSEYRSTYSEPSMRCGGFRLRMRWR